MDELSISQVAKRTGVSARMLRHYDEIGLFSPSRVSPNGYRWYAVESLPRLYRIMALRRAGLGLAAIADIVSDQAAEVGALREHLVELRAERDRLTSLIDAIGEHVAQLDEMHSVGSGERDDHVEERIAFANRLKGQFGSNVGGELRVDPLELLSEADVAHITAEMKQLMEGLAALMVERHRPDSPQVHDLVARHFDLTTRYWPTDLATYRSLGRLYETDPLQRQIAVAAHPDLPTWLSTAIGSFVDGTAASKP